MGPRLSRPLGKTTGWIHRAALQMKQVEMIGGVNCERIGPEGLFVTYGEKRQDGQLIECDTVPRRRDQVRALYGQGVLSWSRV